MPTWPTTVDPPLQGNFEIGAEPNVNEFKPDVFTNSIKARRYTAKGYLHSGVILLQSADQREDLETFFSDDCVDGVLPFTMNDWETGVEATFQWAEQPVYSHVARDIWRANVKLVKMPGGTT